MNNGGGHDEAAIEAEVLAAYDEALAAGLRPSVDEQTLSTLGGGAAEQLRSDIACLELLSERWPRRRQGRDGPPTAPKQLGRFEVRGELGRGGFGIVFLAFDPVLGRDVALKVPRPEVLLTPELRARFVREAQAAAGLNHLNVVTVYEAGLADAVCYIASEYCPGTTLAAWLRGRTAPVAPRQAAALVAVLADALEHIHRRNLLHRDLKPNNVLLQEPEDSPRPPAVDPNGDALGFVPKLTDFGLARPLEGAENVTRSGMLLGTPAYMAPEQAQGRWELVGPAADVYALGAILYEVVTGQPPFRGATELDTLRQVIDDDPAPPRRLRRDLPRDLETVCLKCLQKEPHRRYQGAAELAADLRSYLAGRPVAARPVSPAERAWGWLRRRPAVLTAVAAAALAAAGLLIAATWHQAVLSSVNAELRAALEDSREQSRRARDSEADSLGHAYAANVALAAKFHEAGEPGLSLHWLNLARPGPGAADQRGFEWHYLWRLNGRQFKLQGHGGYVSCLAFSPDGHACVSGSTDATIKVWDRATGRLRFTLAGHKAPVRGLSLSRDGRFLVSAAWSAEVGSEAKLWDAATGRAVAGLDLGRVKVVGATILDDSRTVALGGEDEAGTGLLELWDTAAGRRRPAPWRPRGLVLQQRLSPDGRLLAVAYHDRKDDGGGYGVQVFDLAGGRECLHDPTSTWTLRCLAFSPDSRTLVYASDGASIVCRDASDGAERARFHPAGWVWDVSVSPDNRTLAAAVESATGNGPSTIHLWDLTTKTLRPERHEPGCLVRAVAFTPDGREIAVAGEDRAVQFWSPSAPPTFRRLAGHPEEAWGAAFAPDSRLLATSSDDHTIKLWDPQTGRERRCLKGHASLVTAVAFAPGGALASAGFDGAVKVWDAETGKERKALHGHGGPVRALAFSPDGATLATGGDDRAVRLWDVAAGRPLRTLSGHDDKIRALAFTPDGRLLASAGNDMATRLWDPWTGMPVGVISEPQEVWCLAVSPDGRTLAAGRKDGSIRLQDVTTWTEKPLLVGHVKGVRSVAFSPDGKTLASSGEDRTLRLWHVATGRELLALRGHEQSVNAVAFAPSGRYLASADHSGAVLVWPSGDD